MNLSKHTYYLKILYLINLLIFIYNILKLKRGINSMKIKNLIFIPIILFIFSVFILYQNKQNEGSWIKKDIDLRGGLLVTIESSQKIDAKQIENILTQKYGSVIVSSLRTSTGYGATIEADISVQLEDIINTLKESNISINSYSAEVIGPSLGKEFFNQVRNILIIGFCLMAIMIFFVYKNPLPSFSMVFAVAGDILAALAITSLFGVEIGFAGFVSLLMFIAYAVDTNIVLTSSVLKIKKEEFKQEYKNALKTGLTMTSSVILTMAVVLILSTSKLLTNIASVLLVGFAADIIFTWIFNAGLLQYYIERR